MAVAEVYKSSREYVHNANKHLLGLPWELKHFEFEYMLLDGMHFRSSNFCMQNIHNS